MNSQRTIITAFFGYSLAMLLGCTLPVYDGFADEQPHKEIVKFHDLNVNTAAGAKTLYARIHGAAMRVCHEFDPVVADGIPGCVLHAEARAIQEINAPALTAYYRTQTRHRV